MGLAAGMSSGIVLRSGISSAFPSPFISSLFEGAEAWDDGFVRTTAGQVRNHEDVWVTSVVGELRFPGLRRVQNLFTASDVPATQIITVVVGARYAFYFRDDSGTGSYALTGAATETVAEGEAFTFTATTTTLTATLTGSPGASATVQLEETSGASVNAPSEYVAIGTTYNAFVAGVKYFTTTNGNTFSAPGPGTVTEAAGSTIAAATRRGALIEPQRTTVIRNSFDITTGWGQTGANSSLDQPGIDGRDDKASLLEDPGAGYQSLERTETLSGTGATAFTVFVLKDSDVSRFPEFQINGVTTVDVQVQLNTSTGATATRNGTPDYIEVDLLGLWWRFRFGLTATSTTAVVKIFPAVSSAATGIGNLDASASGTIVVGNVQVEQGAIGTSPIYTTGSAATRNADDMSTVADWPAEWTVYFRGTLDQLGDERTLFGATDTSTNRIYINASGNLVVQHGVTTTTTANAVSAGTEFVAIVTYDGTDILAILDDGVLVDDTAGATFGDEIQIGARSDLSNSYNDPSDEVVVFFVALSEAQMRTLF